MRAPQVGQLPAFDAGLELDEAFLERVDRAVLLCKQRDPYRTDQNQRALEDEVQRAGPRNQEREQSNCRSAGTVSMNTWEAR